MDDHQGQTPFGPKKDGHAAFPPALTEPVPYSDDGMVPMATSYPDFGAVASSDIAFCGPASVAEFVKWCQTWVKRLHWFRGQILDNLGSPVLDGDREWVSEYIESATPKTVADHCRQQLHEFGIIDIPQSLDCSDEDVDPDTLEYCQRVERLLSWATGRCRAQFSQPPPPTPAPTVGQTPAERTPETPTDYPAIALLSVFTNGVSDDRIKRASQVLADDTLTANEKLTKIDALMPFPPTASAEKLGELLGKSKQAVLKTDWWIQKRKGEKDDEIGRRRAGHQQRTEGHEKRDATDDDDGR
jgi:hypothetical protein